MFRGDEERFEMNARIEELVLAAGFSRDFVDDRELADAQQKFARLLVDQCVTFANEEADHLEDEQELGRANDLRAWGRVMKQHFGVE